MKRFLFSLIFIGFFSICFAQQEDATQLHENAKTFMQQGDYGNATLILTRALQQDKENLSIAKDLSLSYFLQKEDQKALNTIKPFLESNNADDQAYQIAGTIYRRLGKDKEAEILFGIYQATTVNSAGLNTNDNLSQAGNSL